jgi:hypothetical protein
MKEFFSVRSATHAQCLAAGERCGELLSLGKELGCGCREVLEACARICAVAAEELQFGTVFRRQVCALCAVLCRACYDECRQHDGELFARCADACEQAARECRAVAVKT